MERSAVAGPVVPAVVVVEVVVLALHGVAEHVLEVGVVGLLLELEVAGVEKEVLELVGQRLAQFVYRNRQFLLHYLLVLLLLGVGLEVLPRHRPLDEVEQHVGNALDVVAAALLDAEVRVEGGEAGSAGEVLVVLVGDVGVVLELVLLGESEVDHVDLAALLPVPRHEVVRLHVPVDELTLVHVLDPLQHLVTHHQRRLQVVLLTAHVEQVLQRLPAQVHHHHVVLALRPHVVHVRETGVDGRVVLQPAQDLGLVEELRTLGGALLELDGVLGVVFDVERHEYLPERSRAQLLCQLVVLRHDAVHKLYKVLSNYTPTHRGTRGRRTGRIQMDQPKLKTLKNLVSMPPRIRSTTVKLSPFLMSISTAWPITRRRSPFSSVPYSSGASTSNSAFSGRISTFDLSPLIDRMIVTSPLVRSLTMFSMMRAVSSQRQVQAQMDLLIWDSLPQRCARSMQANSTMRSSRMQFLRSNLRKSQSECSSTVSSRLCRSRHSTITTRRYSPASSASSKTMCFWLPYRPLIQRYPPSYSRCRKMQRTHRYSVMPVWQQKRFSFCRTSSRTRVFLKMVKVRTEVVSLGGGSRNLALGLSFGRAFSSLGGQTGQLTAEGYSLKAYRKTEENREGNWASYTVATSLLLAGSQQPNSESVVQLSFTRNSGRYASFCSEYPSSVEPSLAWRVILARLRLGSGLFLRCVRGSSMQGVPVSSATKSRVLPQLRFSQQLQQLAQAFSRRKGQRQTGSPSAGSRLRKAGEYFSSRLMRPLRLRQGTRSSTITYRHACYWQIFTRQIPRALASSLSNIVPSSYGLRPTALKQSTRYGAERPPLTTNPCDRRPRVNTRKVFPGKISESRSHTISSLLRERLTFLWTEVVKREASTGGKRSSMYFSPSRRRRSWSSRASYLRRVCRLGPSGVGRASLHLLRAVKEFWRESDLSLERPLRSSTRGPFLRMELLRLLFLPALCLTAVSSSAGRSSNWTFLRLKRSQPSSWYSPATQEMCCELLCSVVLSSSSLPAAFSPFSAARSALSPLGSPRSSVLALLSELLNR